MKEQYILIIIVFVFLLIYISSSTKCMCKRSKSRFTLKADNGLYISDSGHASLATPNDCRAQWKIINVGLGKVALKSVYSRKFLSKCASPCENNVEVLNKLIDRNINCNTDGHFTLIDRGGGFVYILANNGQYVTRCDDCSGTEQNRLLLLNSPVSASTFMLEKVR